MKRIIFYTIFYILMGSTFFSLLFIVYNAKREPIQSSDIIRLEKMNEQYDEEIERLDKELQKVRFELKLKIESYERLARMLKITQASLKTCDATLLLIPLIPDEDETNTTTE